PTIDARTRTRPLHGPGGGRRRSRRRIGSSASSATARENARQMSHRTPPQPRRSAVRPEEFAAYDRVVARQKSYDYRAFLELVPEEHRQAFAEAAGVTDTGGDCAPEDRVQPYMGAMLNSPLFMNLISELGVVARTRGEHPDSYSHANRE